MPELHFRNNDRRAYRPLLAVFAGVPLAPLVVRGGFVLVPWGGASGLVEWPR